MGFLGAQHGFGHAEEVNHLGDTEQRRNHNHTAEAAAEEGRRSLVLESFAKNNQGG